jgi:hypothetical protein
MKKDPIKYSAGLFFIFLLFLSSSCEDLGFSLGGSGTLTGKITIGPICPVERIPPDPACQPTAETYKAYPVSVWTIDMKRKIMDLSPALNGNYEVSLPAGTWMVVLENMSKAIGGSNLPVSITVKEDSDTQLDIDIDTGIR